jgi:hypothetical protein
MSGNLWLWVSNRNGLQSKGKGRGGTQLLWLKDVADVNVVNVTRTYEGGHRGHTVRTSAGRRFRVVIKLCVRRT